jgi:hypothetical protein
MIKGFLPEREKGVSVNYKGTTVRHKFFAEFILFDTVILEVKGVQKASWTSIFHKS